MPFIPMPVFPLFKPKGPFSSLKNKAGMLDLTHIPSATSLIKLVSYLTITFSVCLFRDYWTGLIFWDLMPQAQNSCSMSASEIL